MTSLAIMQPYFFPYIGYFQLINLVDKWVVLDNVQHIRRGWINRNRVLSPNLDKGWRYINVNLVKNSVDALINEMVISDTVNWKDIILGKLSYYRNIKAPYYSQTIELVRKSIRNSTNHLVTLNMSILEIITDYIGINFNYSICSQESFDLSSVSEPDDWAFEISKQMSISTYINSIGGASFFKKEKFLNEGINIKFLKTDEVIYKQSKRTSFVSFLSIIDMLMFNSIDAIKDNLTRYELV